MATKKKGKSVRTQAGEKVIRGETREFRAVPEDAGEDYDETEQLDEDGYPIDNDDGGDWKLQWFYKDNGTWEDCEKDRENMQWIATALNEVQAIRKSGRMKR